MYWNGMYIIKKDMGEAHRCRELIMMSMLLYQMIDSGL